MNHPADRVESSLVHLRDLLADVERKVVAARLSMDVVHDFAGDAVDSIYIIDHDRDLYWKCFLLLDGMAGLIHGAYVALENDQSRWAVQFCKEYQEMEPDIASVHEAFDALLRHVGPRRE